MASDNMKSGARTSNFLDSFILCPQCSRRREIPPSLREKSPV